MMQRLHSSVLLGYSTGALTTGIFSTVPSILLLFYMTDILGIPAQLAAFGVFIPKLWDMISDPLVGYVSDKTVSRWGRRRPFLYVGSWLMPVCFMLIFMVPDFENPTNSFLYVLITFILAATTYTIFAVPYMAMLSEMSEDAFERVRIVSYRMTVAMIGVLFGASVAPFIIDYYGGGKAAYAYMAVILSLACFVSMLITCRSARDIPLLENKHEPLSILLQLRQTLQNKPFLVLLSIYLFQLTGIGVFSAILPYFVSYILQEGQGYLGTLFFLYLGMSTVCIPLWGWLGNHHGKLLSYNFAILFFCLGLVGLSLDFLRTEVCMILLGIGFAGLQVLPYSLLTDVVRYDAEASGVSREGMLTGVWTACEKTGLAMGPLIGGTILALSGFVENAGDGEIVKQSAEALWGIEAAVSIIPAFIITLSITIIRYLKIPSTRFTSKQQLAE